MARLRPRRPWPTEESADASIFARHRRSQAARKAWRTRRRNQIRGIMRENIGDPETVAQLEDCRLSEGEWNSLANFPWLGQMIGKIMRQVRKRQAEAIERARPETGRAFNWDE